MLVRSLSLVAAFVLATSSAFAGTTAAAIYDRSAPNTRAPNLTDLGDPPPASVIVSAGGMEWVWANPCGGTPDDLCGGGQGGVLLHSGFAFATDAQWLASFADAADLVAQFGDKCAASYFSYNFDHCDVGDAAAGYIWHSPLAGSIEQSMDPYSETFLVRVVPEPETYALMLAGLGLVGYVARRRKLNQS